MHWNYNSTTEGLAPQGASWGILWPLVFHFYALYGFNWFAIPPLHVAWQQIHLNTSFIFSSIREVLYLKIRYKSLINNRRGWLDVNDRGLSSGAQPRGLTRVDGMEIVSTEYWDHQVWCPYTFLLIIYIEWLTSVYKEGTLLQKLQGVILDNYIM